MRDTTFINGDEKLIIRGLEHLESRIEDFTGFMEHGYSGDDPEVLSEEAREFFYKTGSFYEYGLSFGLVESGTFDDQKEQYYCYQLSWGGPSDEIRFYSDRIEYVFLDWFVGVGFDVTGEEWVEWLRSDAEDCGTIDPEKLTHYECDYEEED